MSRPIRKAPLSGIKMLDFGHIVAGPFCARLIADLGADVVKVETATRLGRTGARRGSGGGDALARTPLLAHINRNRRSIDLNLKSERGLEIARRLIDKADVLVENFSSGVMERLGLGYEQVRKTNPGLVYASMSAYGHSGPRHSWTGMNVNLQAYSGMMMATGAPNDPPIGIANSWNDYIGGLHTAVGIVGALQKRQASGEGCHLDLSQFESSVGMLGSYLLASTVNGTAPPRTGSRSVFAAPQGVYPCAGEDQWCTLSVQSDAEWQNLLAEMGEAGATLRDPRFATLAGRRQGHDEIDAALGAWTRTMTPLEVERRLAKAKVPAAAMRRGNDLADVAEWKRVLKPLVGSKQTGERSVGSPVAFTGCEPVPTTVAPRVGEHGRDVLRDWLGFDEAAIDKYLSEEVAA
jgi:crotonobetainyl-CoA:carnitine CoA-transferase CaiB-like acyl-CoA transferase